MSARGIRAWKGLTRNEKELVVLTCLLGTGAGLASVLLQSVVAGLGLLACALTYAAITRSTIAHRKAAQRRARMRHILIAGPAHYGVLPLTATGKRRPGL